MMTGLGPEGRFVAVIEIESGWLASKRPGSCRDTATADSDSA